MKPQHLLCPYCNQMTRIGNSNICTCNRCSMTFTRSAGHKINRDFQNILLMIDEYLSDGDSYGPKTIFTINGTRAIVKEITDAIEKYPRDSNGYLHLARFLYVCCVYWIELVKGKDICIDLYVKNMNFAAKCASGIEKTYILQERDRILEKMKGEFAKRDDKFNEKLALSTEYVDKYFEGDANELVYGGDSGYKAVIAIFRDLAGIYPDDYRGRLLHARFLLRIMNDKSKSININVDAFKEHYISLMNDAVELSPVSERELLLKELKSSIGDSKLDVTDAFTNKKMGANQHALNSESPSEDQVSDYIQTANIKRKASSKKPLPPNQMSFGGKLLISLGFVILYYFFSFILSRALVSEPFSRDYSLLLSGLLLVAFLISSIISAPSTLVTMALSVLLIEIPGQIVMDQVGTGVILGIVLFLVFRVFITAIPSLSSVIKLRNISILILVTITTIILPFIPYKPDENNTASTEARSSASSADVATLSNIGSYSSGSSDYKIANAVFEDLSYNSTNLNAECVRVQYRIWIETTGKASRSAVEALAKDLVAQVTSRFDINALSIFVYDGPNIYGEYTVASVDWAPYGNWGRADEVKTGDYSKHSYTIRMR